MLKDKKQDKYIGTSKINNEDNRGHNILNLWKVLVEVCFTTVKRYLISSIKNIIRMFNLGN